MRRIVGVMFVSLMLTACGGDGVREVSIDMFEMGYRPATVEVEVGETVRFVVENTGNAAHELFIGTDPEHVAREALLATGENPPDPASLILRRGESGVLEYTFDGQGTLMFACHIIGHYAAGMVGEVVVG